VYSAFGFGGYLLVCLYFIFGTLVRPAPHAPPTFGSSTRARAQHAAAACAHADASSLPVTEPGCGAEVVRSVPPPPVSPAGESAAAPKQR
jgi:hypothetical protein